VPSSQIFGFGLIDNDNISRNEFRNSLEKPLSKALETKKLWHIGSEITRATTNKPAHMEWKVTESKIRYLVLCYGVPLRISGDPTLQDEKTDPAHPQLKRDGAALDSELALLPLVEQKYPLGGPLMNPVAGATNTAALHPTNGILLVTRLDGPSAAIARALVDKAMEAETNGLWGRAYFDLRNISDPGYKMGDDWIRTASEICRHVGFETVVDEHAGTFPASFPMSQIAIYAGWYDQDVSGPFARPQVEFMPGAFAYHLHSYSASTLHSMTQGWAGPLLGKGATITMGCVDEPYLAGTPEIGVFIARLILHGFTFGEAAYAAQGALSWQTTVVGDPLYRPFGKNPELVHQELEKRQSKFVEWSWLKLVDMNLANGKTIPTMVTLLEELPTTKKSAVLSEKLADLYAAQGKPSSAVHSYAEALKQDPSPQQTIRLLLNLGDKLIPLGRDGEAYDAFQKLMQQFPDYPGKLSVYQKLLPLAQKLNKKADAEKYEAEIKSLTPQPKS